MNNVHEQCPISDSETVPSQKRVKCTVCTHNPASTPRCTQARPGVVSWLGPPAVSQRRARPCALCRAPCHAPAPPVPRAQHPRDPTCVPSAPAGHNTLSLGSSPIQFCTKKKIVFFSYIYFSFNYGPFCPKFPQHLLI